MKTAINSNSNTINSITAVLERDGDGVWQLTDSEELIFTAVGSGRGLTVSDVIDNVEDAIKNKPAITAQLLDTLAESQRADK